MKSLAIALNTFRDTVRQRLFVNLVLFALILILGSLVISGLTLGDQYRIIVNTALSSAQVFGTIIAVLLGINLVTREVESRTLYFLVAKPLSRSEFLLGKYVGLALVLAVNLLAMSVAIVIAIFIYKGNLSFLAQGPLIRTLLFMLLDFLLCAAIATFFSSFTTSTLAAIYSLGIVVAGHLSADLRYFGGRSKSEFTRHLSEWLYYGLPNLEAFNLREAVVYNDPVTFARLGWAAMYGVAYGGIVLLIATFIFARRDLK